jgi:hypothetical protein
MNVNHTTGWALNGEGKTRKHEIFVRIGVEFKTCKDRQYENVGELKKTGYMTCHRNGQHRLRCWAVVVTV